jgi:hypothetical protein
MRLDDFDDEVNGIGGSTGVVPRYKFLNAVEIGESSVRPFDIHTAMALSFWSAEGLSGSK